MESFELVMLVVLLSSILLGGSSQSFLASKRFPDIFPALGHGVPAWMGHPLMVGVYYLEFLLVKVPEF